MIRKDMLSSAAEDFYRDKLRPVVGQVATEAQRLGRTIQVVEFNFFNVGILFSYKYNNLFSGLQVY